MRPYNIVILNFLKSNMKLQLVLGVYVMLTYLTSYICKPEHALSEILKQASNETYVEDIKGKIYNIGKTFLTKSSAWSDQKSIIFAYDAFKYRCFLYSYPSRKKRTRMLKSLWTLEKMYPDDSNPFTSSIIVKYENRPDNLN